MKRALNTVAGTALLTMLAAAPVAALDAPPSHEMGFVITRMANAMGRAPDENCPDGRSGTIRQNYVAALAPQERERLLKPENGIELDQKWKANAQGPNHTNVCTNYDQFPDRPQMHPVKGGTAVGFNLSGDGENTYTCAHEKFTSPSGEAGIDNQAYRASGCQGGGDKPDSAAAAATAAALKKLALDDYTRVLLLRGVDSLQNDDNVEVIVASSDDRPIADNDSNVLTGTTFRIVSNPRWRHVLKGRIVNGVLITEPKDVVLRRTVSVGGPRGLRAEWDFGHMQMRLTIKDDGTLDGMMGGYQPFLSFIQIPAYGGIGSALTAGIDCAATYNALKRLADGGRDPKTGECTRISSAMKVAAVPAFVIDAPLVADEGHGQTVGQRAASARGADDTHPPGLAPAKSKMGQVLADARGQALYAMEARLARSRYGEGAAKYCSGPCLDVWTPLAAPAEAAPVGAWTISEGASGRQWTFKGNLVFTFNADKPGDTGGHAYSEDLWNVIPYIPPKPKLTVPANVTTVFADDDYILADQAGHPLYTAAKACAGDCQPFVAGQAGHDVGAWTIARDGDRVQWVYKGKRVYVAQAGLPWQVPEGSAVLKP